MLSFKFEKIIVSMLNCTLLVFGRCIKHLFLLYFHNFLSHALSSGLDLDLEPWFFVRIASYIFLFLMSVVFVNLIILSIILIFFCHKAAFYSLTQCTLRLDSFIPYMYMYSGNCLYYTVQFGHRTYVTQEEMYFYFTIICILHTFHRELLQFGKSCMSP